MHSVHASASSVPLFSHPKKGCPLRLSVSFLLHLFNLLIRMRIEQHPGLAQDSCPVCGSRGHSVWVALLCMVCDQWCHCRCAGIHSVQTTCSWSRGTAPQSSPPSQLLRPPGRRSPLTWSARARPSRPGATSPSSPSPSNLAHLPRRALPLQDQPLKEAGFYSSTATAFNIATQNCRISFTVTRCWSLATIRRDRPTGGCGLVTLVHHSVPYREPNDDTEEVLAVQTDLGGTTLTFVNVCIPPVSSSPRNYAPDFDDLLV